MNKNILLKFNFQVCKEKINDNLSITVFLRLPIPICNTRYVGNILRMNKLYLKKTNINKKIINPKNRLNINLKLV